jgi:hypothetical protein
VDVRTILRSPPLRLQLSADPGEVTYELADDLIAAHGADPGPTAVLTLDDISVEPLPTRSRELEDRVVGPVYRHTADGQLAVPTGRVFVRFAPGDSAARHEEDIAAAGYQVQEVPSYAPHAAWLSAASGTVVDALRGLDRVRRLPGVEHAEPQLLTAPARRP